MIRSSLSNFDYLFGDDPTKAFEQAYPIEVYVQSVDQFEGGEIFSKFGLEVRKQARFLVTKRSFLKGMPAGFGRPREGDILWMSNFAAFFEVKYVDEEQMFYTFGNAHLYGYSLVCEKWNYAQEQVNTGYSAIDKTINKLAITYQYNVVLGGTGTFEQGETVTQGNTSGVVAKWDLPSGNLVLKEVNGTFHPNTVIVGSDSGASYVLIDSNVRDDVSTLQDNNQEISLEADNVLNFSEENPFGQPIEP